MNGKIAVKVIGVKGAYNYIYLQPNYFNRINHLTYGVLENNMIHPKEENGQTFYIPSDWNAIIVYNI